MKDKNGVETSAADLYAYLRSRPHDELLEELEEIMDSESVDSELVFAYNKILEELQPCPVTFDADRCKQEIEDKYPELFEPDEEPDPVSRRPRRRLNFRLRAAVLVVALIGGLTLVATAKKIPFLNMAWEWAVDTFSVEPATGQTTLLEASDEGFYSLQEALDSYQVEDKVDPKWIPKDFTISQINVLHSDKTKAITFTVQYSANNGRDIHLRIITNDYLHIENERTKGENVEEFDYNGITYFITTNEEQVITTWDTESCFCRLSGDITREDMIRMIKSTSEE